MMVVCVDWISFTPAPMKTKAKPIPADASLSLGKTAGCWALVHDGAFADWCCHPDAGGICRALRPGSWPRNSLSCFVFSHEPRQWNNKNIPHNFFTQSTLRSKVRKVKTFRTLVPPQVFSSVHLFSPWFMAHETDYDPSFREPRTEA